MTEESEIAATLYFAPLGLQARWNQIAMKRINHRWRSNRKQEFRALHSVLDDDTPYGYIDIHNTPTSVGEHGNSSGYELDYSIDERLVDTDNDTEGLPEMDLLHEFAQEYLDTIAEALLDDCPEMLSEREFLIYVAYQGAPEGRVADAFDISTGTVRGKVGRVREKFEKAEELLRFRDMADSFDTDDNTTYTVSRGILDRIDEGEFPVQTSQGPNLPHPVYKPHGPDAEADLLARVCVGCPESTFIYRVQKAGRNSQLADRGRRWEGGDGYSVRNAEKKGVRMVSPLRSRRTRRRTGA